MTIAIEFLLILLILLGFLIISIKKDLLDFSGALTALIIGLIAFVLAGFNAVFVFLIVFVLVALTTKYYKKTKKELRTAVNILGNSLIALIALLFNNLVVFSASLSTALSDTLSAEIGEGSKKVPRLITNFKRVKIGSDGGITLIGLVVGLIGAFFIGVLHYFLFSNSINELIIVSVAGITGNLVDSFLGATLQKKKLIGNSTVNFIACGTAGLIALLFQII